MTSYVVLFKHKKTLRNEEFLNRIKRIKYVLAMSQPSSVS
jgi:hypothetical protein